MKVDLVSTLDKMYGVQTKKETRKPATNVSTGNSSEKTKKGDSLEISPNLLKINQIKSRVYSGGYENKDVINEIAKRLIEYSEI